MNGLLRALHLQRFPFTTVTLEPTAVARLQKPDTTTLLATALVIAFEISFRAMLQCPGGLLSKTMVHGNGLG
ncbi:hypothetical protein BC374_19955 [Ensifer sp. LC13]|nr:hypothetical protein BC374_19955 [Ensifer sp. LC13]OCP09814.1 hypothetical protein BC362_08730 [Ensifer sp. LC14]OCP32279.1 hypothetical protein BC364_19225 [Ensifer sp. LC499]